MKQANLIFGSRTGWRRLATACAMAVLCLLVLCSAALADELAGPEVQMDDKFYLGDEITIHFAEVANAEEYGYRIYRMGGNECIRTDSRSTPGDLTVDTNALLGPCTYRVDFFVTAPGWDEGISWLHFALLDPNDTELSRDGFYFSVQAENVHPGTDDHIIFYQPGAGDGVRLYDIGDADPADIDWEAYDRSETNGPGVDAVGNWETLGDHHFYMMANNGVWSEPVYVGTVHVVPALAMDDWLMNEVEWVYSAWFEPTDSVWLDNWLGNAVIANYDEMLDWFGGEPQWDVTLTSGNVPEGGWYWFLGNDPREIFVRANYDVYQPAAGDHIEFDVSCSWGVDTVSYIMPVDFVDYGTVPTGNTVPEIIELRLNTENRIDLDFVPSGYQVPGCPKEIYLNFYGGFNGDQRFEDYTLYLTPHESGNFPARLEVATGNIISGRIVTFRVRNANGGLTAPALTFEPGHASKTVEQVVAADDPEIRLGQHGHVDNITLDEACYLIFQSMYGGEPEWSIKSATNVGAGTFSLNPWGWEGSRGCDLNVESYPASDVTSVVKVTCSWGGKSVTATRSVNFETNAALPTGLNVPDTVWGLQAGQEYRLPVGFTPAGRSYNAKTWADLNAPDYYGLETWWDWDTHEICIVPHQAGMFPVNIALNSAGVRVEKDVVLFVADGEGNDPSSDLQFTDWTLNDAQRSYVAWFEPYSSGDSDIWQDNLIGNAEIADFDAQRLLRSDDPQWSVTPAVGEIPDGGWYWYPWDDGRGIDIRLDYAVYRPTADESIAFDVGCEWSGESIGFRLTVDFIGVNNLPTGSNIPFVLDLALEEDNVFPLDFIPSGYEVDGRGVYIGSHGDFDRDEWCDGYTQHIRPHQSGLFTGWLQVVTNNIVCGHDVVFRVADEEGNPPDSSLRFTEDTAFTEHKTFSSWFEGTDDVWLDGWTGSAEIAEFDAMRVLFGGQPEWNVQLIAGEIPEGGWSWNPWDDPIVADIWLNYDVYHPTAGDQIAFEITCAWGNETVRRTIFIDFVDVNPPTGNTIPAFIDLALEEIGSVDIDFDPVGFELYDRRVYTDFYVPFDCDRWGDGYTEYYRPHQTGTFTGWVNVQAGNIRSGHDVLFRVTDGDGEWQEPELRFEDDRAYNHTGDFALFADTGAVWHDDYVFGCGIPEDVYRSLHLLYGCDPEWTFTKTSGDADFYSECGNGGNDPRCYDVWVDREPNAPGSASFEVTCTWGGQSMTGVCTVNFDYVGSLPTGIDQPNIIEMNMGDEYAFSIDADMMYEGNPWRSNHHRWIDIWIDNDDINNYFDAWDGQDNYGNDSIQYIRAKAPGRFLINVSYREGNITTIKTMVVLVRDENGDLPDMGLRFDEDADQKTYAAWGETNEGVWMAGWLGNTTIADFDAQRLLHDGDPEWNVELVSGSIPEGGWDWNHWEEYRGVDFWLNYEAYQPAVGDDIAFEITCNWGNDSVSRTVYCHFADIALPTGSDIPYILDLDLGVENRIDLDFLPHDYEIANRWVNIGFYDDFDGDYWCDGYTQYIRPYQPGFYTGHLHVNTGNVGAGHDVMFRVKDENGNLNLQTSFLPGNLKEIGEEAFAGINANIIYVPDGCERIGDGAFADCPYLFEVHIPDSVTVIEGDPFENSPFNVIITNNPMVTEWAHNLGYPCFGD